MKKLNLLGLFLILLFVSCNDDLNTITDQGDDSSLHDHESDSEKGCTDHECIKTPPSEPVEPQKDPEFTQQQIDSINQAKKIETLISRHNIYYGNLHNHTSLSDGTGLPEDAYRTAEGNGLDFLGVAEHAELMVNNTNRLLQMIDFIGGIFGASNISDLLTKADTDKFETLKKAAKDYTKDNDFVAIYGFEWSSELWGHISIINSEEFLPAYLNTDDLIQAGSNALTLTMLPFDELLKWLPSQENAFAFFNHPGREENPFQNNFEHFDRESIDQFVGMELWNKTRGFDSFYYQEGFYENDGFGYYDEALSRGWKIGALGNHDHHDTKWGEVDMSTAILASELTTESVIDAYKNRHFYSTEDRSIELYFSLDDKIMGDTTSRTDKKEMIIVAQDKDPQDEMQKFEKVQLFRNGRIYKEYVLTDNANEKVQIVDEIELVSDTKYFYVKVTQKDGNEAISSPIFIE